MKSLGAPKAILAFAIVVFLALVWTAEAKKSETIDEGLFIGEGVAQISLLNPNFDLSHPPLLRWVAGSSAMLFGGARLYTPPVAETPAGAMALGDYKQEPDFNFTAAFFYDQHYDHDRVLFWGRFPFALIAVATALLIFRAVRRSYDELIAAIAAIVFLFTPEVLAHSQWAHSDLAAALATLIVALALIRSTERPLPRNDLLLGAALGVAVLAKITSTALVPVAIAVVIFFHFRRPRTERKGNVLRRVATVAAMTWLVIIAGYLPKPRLFTHEFLATDIARTIHSTPDSRSVQITRDVLRHLPAPDGFLKGLIYTKLLSDRGQVSFLHGEVRSTGWWYYYPVAFLLKYPPTLLLLALAGLILLWRTRSLTLEQKVGWTALPVALFLLTLSNRVNIGVRALLPIAPFLALWCAAALAAVWTHKTPRIVASVLALASIASGIAAYPNFLTYFTPIVGGTRAADRWLVDSNLDWGQDLPALRDALKKRNAGLVRLAFFGAGRPEHYGISYLPITGRDPGWYAVSRSYLSGWWPPGDPYRWLRETKPDELVGGSIALFRIPGDEASNSTSLSAAPDSVKMLRAMDLMYARHDYASAISVLDQILQTSPHHYGAMWQRAYALDALGRRDEARSAWQQTVNEAQANGYTSGLDHARQRLSELEGSR